jgi:hypothetical protein
VNNGLIRRPGGDKPRRYFLDKDSSVGVSFVTARIGLNIDSLK